MGKKKQKLVNFFYIQFFSKKYYIQIIFFFIFFIFLQVAIEYFLTTYNFKRYLVRLEIGNLNNINQKILNNKNLHFYDNRELLSFSNNIKEKILAILNQNILIDLQEKKYVDLFNYKKENPIFFNKTYISSVDNSFMYTFIVNNKKKDHFSKNINKLAETDFAKLKVNTNNMYSMFIHQQLRLLENKILKLCKAEINLKRELINSNYQNNLIRLKYSFIKNNLKEIDLVNYLSLYSFLEKKILIKFLDINKIYEKNIKINRSKVELILTSIFLSLFFVFIKLKI